MFVDEHLPIQKRGMSEKAALKFYKEHIEMQEMTWKEVQQLSEIVPLASGLFERRFRRKSWVSGHIVFTYQHQTFDKSKPFFFSTITQRKLQWGPSHSDLNATDWEQIR